jgi:hypothetical protein
LTQTHQRIFDDFSTKLQGTDSVFSTTHGAMSTLEYEDFCRYMFQNWTLSQPSFRLTNIGYVILSRMYQCWRFGLDKTPPGEFATARTQVFLRRHVPSPHYWDHRWFYLFDNELAMELEMAQGDFKLWMEMFT